MLSKPFMLKKIKRRRSVKLTQCGEVKNLEVGQGSAERD